MTTIFLNETSTAGHTYSWNFNDGNTSTSKNDTHQFPCPSGTCVYSINHSVSNAQGTVWLNRSNYITIYAPINVQWTAAPLTGNSSVVITFNDTSTETGSSYSWIFNDGNTSASRNVTKQFPCSSGTCVYSINHSATNSGGTYWLNRSNYITITNAPLASFTANRTGYLGGEPQAAGFTDTTTNTPTSWGWNMTELNGTRIQFSTSQNPGQLFYQGNWSVTLTAGNTFGTNISTAVWENVTPPTTLSLALNQSSFFLPLNATASPATNTSLALIVSSNVANFYVTVRDNSVRLSDTGFMGNWTPSAYVGSPYDVNLTHPLAISGTTNGTTIGKSVSLLLAVGQNLFDGGGAVANQLLSTGFSQEVTFDDDILPANYEYRLDLEFTITAP